MGPLTLKYAVILRFNLGVGSKLIAFAVISD